MTPTPGSRFKIGIFILAAAVALALVKPAVHLLLKPEAKAGYGLHWDYGVPTQWYGTAAEARPQGVRLPENSIGLDFLSFDTYVRCKGLGPDLYGSHCDGDPFRRPFAYPPLLTAAFFWIPFVSTQAAVGIWSIAVLALFFANGVLWGVIPSGRNDGRLAPGTWPAAFLLTISYPVVFAFERGNTEVILLSGLSLAAWAIVRRSWFWLGFLSAAMAMAKIYPVVTWSVVAALGAALIMTPERRKQGMLLAVGSALGFLIPLILMPQQHLQYFGSILPSYGRLRMLETAGCSFCQSWPSAYGKAGYVMASALMGVAMLHFTIFARRYAVNGEPADRLRSLMSFAFAAGVPVYIPSMTYDYRLILLLPLLMMCLLWDVPARMNARGTGFVMLLAGFAAPRWLEGLAWPKGDYSAFLLLQTIGLALIGLSLVKEAAEHTVTQWADRKVSKL